MNDPFRVPFIEWLLAFIAGAFCTAFLLQLIGELPGQIDRKWQNDVVKRGYGEFVVDEGHEVHFKWSEKP